MSKHNEFGNKAEKIAVKFLNDKNYKILDKNWRYSHLEADIIAFKDNFLVIVEVKARKHFNDNFEEIVPIKKQKHLINLAEKYLEEKNFDYEIRFDVIFITKKNKNFRINHIENAFYPIVE